MERIRVTNVESDLPAVDGAEQEIPQGAANDDDYRPTEVMGDSDNPDTWKAVDMDSTLEADSEPEAANEHAPERQVEGDPNNPDTWAAAPMDASLESEPVPETEEEPVAEASQESTNDAEAPVEDAPEQAPATEAQPEAVGIKAEELDIYSRYKSAFNIDAGELNKIEGFDELKPDQKEFILQNLQQTAMRQVETESITNYRDEKAQASFITKMRLGFTKGYQLNKQKKKIAEDIFNGEVDQTETITALVDMVQEGPKITKLEDGSFQVDMASAEDFKGDLSEGEHEAIDDFNEKANKFNALPYEFKTGTPEQQEKYENLEKEYRLARNTLMLIKKSQGASDQEQLLYGNDIDRKVMMGQFMDANPEVETALMNIKNDTVWKQTLEEILNPKGAASSKGGIMAMGLAGRTTTTTMLGVSSLAALPAIGAGIGLWRGRVDAKDNLTENELLARSGEAWEQDKSFLDRKYEEKTGKEVAAEVRHNIMSAEHLVGKMEKLIERVEESETDEERNKFLTKLHARISYTEEKINSDMVNFGKIHEQAGNQLDLLQALGTAKAYGEMPTDENLEKKVNDFMGYIDNTVDARQKKFVNRRMFQGAALGAGFAFAGAATAEGVDAISEAGDTSTYSEAFSKTGNEAAPGAFDDGDHVMVGGEPSGPESLADHEVIVGNGEGTPPDAESTLKTFMSEEELKNWDAPDSLKQLLNEYMTRGSLDPEAWDSLQIEIDKYEASLSPEMDSDTRAELLKEIHELQIAAEAAEQAANPEVLPVSNETQGETVMRQNDEFGASEQADQLHRQEFTAVEKNIQALVAEINETPDYTVQPGDNIWNIIEKKLEAHDLFKGLEEGQRTHLIDELKDKVEKMSEQELKDFGIKSGNAQLIHAGEGGDVLDFSKIMGGDSVEDAVANAENLSAAQIENIENYVPPQPDVATEASSTGTGVATEGVSSEFKADGETIQVNEGSQQHEQLLDQERGLHGDQYGDMTMEQMVDFKTEERVHDTITELYGSRLLGIDGAETLDWKDIQGKDTIELLRKFEKGDFPAHDQWGDPINNTIGYDSREKVGMIGRTLNDLIAQSELKPIEEETVSDFMTRAMKKIVLSE